MASPPSLSTVPDASLIASQRKLFLGGLSWVTTEDTIRDHFSKYGELIEVIVMRDRLTNKPRGFGFVTFKEQSAADKAFGDEHVLDGRTIDAKPSLPHGEHSSPKSKKIFVGGLAPETTEESFRQHFESFGKVIEAQIMVDHTSGRSRGFGFITFADEASVNAVFGAGSMQELAGKRVEVKPATPKGSGPVGRGPAGAPSAMPPGRAGMGYPHPAARGVVPGRYPGGEYGWGMSPTGYMPMAAGYGGYMPAYGYPPGMMMGGFAPVQYGAMGYPMQQQTVPGVMPRQHAAGQADYAQPQQMQPMQQMQQMQQMQPMQPMQQMQQMQQMQPMRGMQQQQPLQGRPGEGPPGQQQPTRAQRRAQAAAAKAAGGGGMDAAAAKLPDSLTNEQAAGGMAPAGPPAGGVPSSS